MADPARAEPGGHSLVIGEREALVWVLSSKDGIPCTTGGGGRARVPGDLLLIDTTRGCLHNPTRDRGRDVGEATVASAVEWLEQPVVFQQREYPIGCRLALGGLAPRAHGVELAPLIPQLQAFPDPATRSVRMRPTVVPLPAADVVLLCEALAQHVVDRRQALPSYVAALPHRAK
jgi:hypothetical protein